MRYQFIPIKTVIIKNKQTKNKSCWGHGEIVTSCIAGGDAKWYNHHGKQYRGFSKNQLMNVIKEKRAYTYNKIVFNRKNEWNSDTINNMDEHKKYYVYWISQTQKYYSTIFSSVISNSLQLHGLQHARLPCPPPTPTACPNSCP